jgi:hypothetical protein
MSQPGAQTPIMMTWGASTQTAEPLADRIADRIAAVDWAEIGQRMAEDGFAKLPVLLTPRECIQIRELYPDDTHFRSRVDMARHRFGEGEYKYLTYPLPPTVQELREALYPPLAEIANGWMEALRSSTRFPTDLGTFLEQCHGLGQTRATPLILRYEAGGYNAMHQDVYGAATFPLQVVLGLSKPCEEYTGGELILVEQRPRAQSHASAILIGQGEGVVFTTREKPNAGSRGYYRSNLRHGVSRVESGLRLTLGVIFHDAP